MKGLGIIFATALSFYLIGSCNTHKFDKKIIDNKEEKIEELETKLNQTSDLLGDLTQSIYPSCTPNLDAIDTETINQIESILTKTIDSDLEKTIEERAVIIYSTVEPSANESREVFSFGNGFLLSDNLVLTAYHVFGTGNNNYLSDLYQNHEHKVLLKDGTVSKTTIVAFSPRYDLALLTLENPVEGMTTYPTESFYGKISRFYNPSNRLTFDPTYLSEGQIADIENYYLAEEKLTFSNESEGFEFLGLYSPYGSDDEMPFRFPQLNVTPMLPQGTSGSAVLNGQGEVIGVVSNITPMQGTTGISHNIEEFLDNVLVYGMMNGFTTTYDDSKE